MEVRCLHCGGGHSISEEVFGSREKVSVTCPACGKAFQVVSPKLTTLRIEKTRKSVPTVCSEYTEDGRRLALPQDKEIK